MTADAFLKIDGIFGECQDVTHCGEIDVLSWSWEVSQDSTMLSGSGGGAPKATVKDLAFTHAVDKATPNLTKYCFEGKHIKKAVLTLRKAGGIPHEFFRITMYDTVITHVSPIMNGAILNEHVKLSFATMKQEYILQNALGGSSGAITSWIYIKENSTVK